MSRERKQTVELIWTPQENTSLLFLLIHPSTVKSVFRAETSPPSLPSPYLPRDWKNVVFYNPWIAVTNALFSYVLISARFPRIEEASGNVSEHHTSRSSWLIPRTVLGVWNGGILTQVVLRTGSTVIHELHIGYSECKDEMLYYVLLVYGFDAFDPIA